MRCRPDLVLFGEPVDLDALWQAKRAVRDCEVFLAIGTSSSVYPAGGLVRYARDVGAYSSLVNPAHDAGTGFDQHVVLPADVAVPALLAPLLCPRRGDGTAGPGRSARADWIKMISSSPKEGHPIQLPTSGSPSVRHRCGWSSTQRWPSRRPSSEAAAKKSGSNRR